MRTYDCEWCGHAYTDGYGKWVFHIHGAEWVCFTCLAKGRNG